jgi:hypothetical protein
MVVLFKNSFQITLVTVQTATKLGKQTYEGYRLGPQLGAFSAPAQPHLLEWLKVDVYNRIDPFSPPPRGSCESCREGYCSKGKAGD